MRWIAMMVMLYAMIEPASAQWDFSLAPSTGVDGQAVSVRVDDVDGCFHADGFSQVMRDGDQVVATIWIDDTLPPGGCPPEWTTPNHFSLGTFEAGSYAVEIVVCTNAPINPCEARAMLDLLVSTAAARRRTVPTLSWWMSVCAAAVILLHGLHRRAISSAGREHV